jgi:hypothetical protein
MVRDDGCGVEFADDNARDLFVARLRAAIQQKSPR